MVVALAAADHTPELSLAEAAAAVEAADAVRAGVARGQRSLMPGTACTSGPERAPRRRAISPTTMPGSSRKWVTYDVGTIRCQGIRAERGVRAAAIPHSLFLSLHALSAALDDRVT